nr:MAG TPA: hypothetical protein [Bacteriophage sp.]
MPFSTFRRWSPCFCLQYYSTIISSICILTFYTKILFYISYFY